MNLEEAIEHCEEKSCGNSECAAEHRQLAEWLKELKAIKEANDIPKLTDGIGFHGLGFTRVQIQAIEKFVKNYVSYIISKTEL